MRLATIQIDDETQAAVIIEDRVLPIKRINDIRGTHFCTHLFEFIQGCDLQALAAAASGLDPRDGIPLGKTSFQAPYARPGKIWGIGLNYKSHAADLEAQAPVTQPASFMKPATAIIGPGAHIRLPADMGRVTAEAELGVIVGKRCRKVPLEKIGSHIFGYTTIIDMTALDILQKNPRYLTRAKSFDTFFSFGPVVITADELPELSDRVIRTRINGRLIAENVVANMTFNPFELLSFHSYVMTLEPGDIISTGTPGAGVIQPGDTVRCEIDGFYPLENPVAADL
jgi:2-keto-4-pentenoate hydratase/2-oxohepta-3-ene-1,7-dioic acid hydratase in catechol pathway